MVEEDCSVEVAVVLKFDIPNHQSKLSPKDVKSLAKKYNIPLDLHPCAPSEGWTMDKLPEEVIGLYEQFFEFSGLRVPFSTLLLACVGENTGGKIFNETFSGMKGWKDKLFFIDMRVIPDAMAWRHHDSDVNDTLSDNDFSLLDVRALVEKVIDLRPMHPGLLFAVGLATTWDFPGFYHIFKDTGGNVITMSEYLRFPFLFEVLIAKGAVVPATHPVGQNTTPPLPVGQPIPNKTDDQLEEKKKAQTATKKKENKKRANDEGGVAPVHSDSDRGNDEAQHAPEDEHHSASPSPRESANEFVYNFINVNDDKEHVFLSESNAGGLSQQLNRPDPSQGFSNGASLSQTQEILAGQNLEESPPAAQVESNALTNEVALQRPWFKTIRKLVTARQDLEHNARLYTNMANLYKGLKEEHVGCEKKVKALEGERNDLTVVNKDQALRIQELEAEVTRKNSALAAAKRMSADGAIERQKLVSC
ncbi:hypothetical protein Tco_0003013 [Tanacetum coccineum]